MTKNHKMYYPSDHPVDKELEMLPQKTKNIIQHNIKKQGFDNPNRWLSECNICGQKFPLWYTYDDAWDESKCNGNVCKKCFEKIIPDVEYVSLEYNIFTQGLLRKLNLSDLINYRYELLMTLGKYWDGKIGTSWLQMVSNGVMSKQKANKMLKQFQKHGIHDDLETEN